MNKLLIALTTGILMVSVNALAADITPGNPWIACGKIADIGDDCQIPNWDVNSYEYGIAYNSTEPMPVNCTSWNVGLRIINKTPYFIGSDDPTTGMLSGGFIFYRGTFSKDECAKPGEYRQRYWFLDQKNTLRTMASKGCTTTQPVYCRLR